MEPWRQYQQNVAELLTELGFTTKVEDNLTGMGGVVHEVDVSARAVLAGVDVLWVVECKLWESRIPKEKVAALRTILDDLGGDRGLIMSESGFQSGAIRLAAGRNITLSNLSDLRDNADEQIVEARMQATDTRLLNLSKRILEGLRAFDHGIPRLLPELAAAAGTEAQAEFARRPAAVSITDGLAELVARSGIPDVQALVPPGFDPVQMTRKWRAGVDGPAMLTTVGTVSSLISVLNQGKLDEWPIVSQGVKGPMISWSRKQLLDVLEPIIGQIDQQVVEQERRITGSQ